ncbi:uncharacterized protein LOC128098766 [Peromyscus californicus insignis]|uniref:uncharacterized protein LOC128098766 n=1 Tax=Peromyscus californicus insignis TaxID=564181 RepID=UPI0022A6F7BC|nr:uncharacterized protein LOC128098766 [Peromyscus californicus insignis]
MYSEPMMTAMAVHSPCREEVVSSLKRYCREMGRRNSSCSSMGGDEVTCHGQWRVTAQAARRARGRCGTTHWRGSSEQPSRAPAPPPPPPPSASCLRARTPTRSRLGPGPTPPPPPPPPPAPQPRSPAVPAPRSPAAPRPRGRRPRSKLAGASGLGGSPPPHLFELVAVGSARLRLAFGKVTRRREARRGGGRGRRARQSFIYAPRAPGIRLLGSRRLSLSFSGCKATAKSLCNSAPARTLPGMYRGRGAFCAEADDAAAEAAAAASSGAL